MLFDSPIYLISLSLVVLVYWRLGHKQQNNFLLLFSYFFYGWWDWRFLGLILISTLVDFYCANAIAASGSQRRRRALLAISVSMNLGFLGFFKYFNFFVDSAQVALHALGVDISPPVLKVILPPGISFYTFQAIAYMVDVYAGRLPATRSLRDYALFICLFPHLIAGPIQRPDHLLPQVQKERRYDPRTFTNGLMLIISGLFRKCVIADQCALLANGAFNGAFGAPSITVLAIGSYAFAWQIYGDFSGYSNIARGSAQLLGFHFMVNFRQPYLALSLQDFWRRWHISLSTWLRDYLYIPLGGNRGGEARTYRNLLFTMLLGGLWHGANWTFVVWGALHGGGLALERALGFTPGQQPSRLRRWILRLLVFHVVCLAWIFFRAGSLAAAVELLGGLGRWTWRPEFAPAFLMLAVFGTAQLLIDVAESRRNEEYLGEHATFRVRLLIAAAILAATIFLAASSVNAFIYFRF
jgi:D-alanyl-lipoteichoic acid acyltransferase DltB (MBOAT superfamily)